MMEASEDNTAVFRMRKEFASFLSDRSASHARRQGLTLDLSDAVDADTSNRTSMKSPNNLSMQALIEKEKAERLRQAELLKAKAHIAEVESKLITVETSRKRARIEFEKEVADVKRGYQNEISQINELRQQLKVMATREEDARAQLVEMRKQMEAKKASFEEKRLNMQKEKNTLQNMLEEIEETYQTKLADVKKVNLRHQTELEISNSALEEKQSQLEAALNKNKVLKKVAQEIEEYKTAVFEANHKIKTLEAELQSLKDDKTVANAMRTQIAKLPELERENAHLRKENQYHKDTKENIYLLREEVIGLRQKAERANKTTEELSKLQIQYEDLQNKLQKWENIECLGNKLTSPSKLSQRVRELQAENAVLLEKQGQLQSSVHSLQQTLQRSGVSSQSTQEELVRHQLKANQQADFMKRLQKKLLLMTKERDGFKQILESYESEATVNITSASVSRIQHLEDLVASYQEQVAGLEVQLASAADTVTEQAELIAKLERRKSEQLTQAAASVVPEADQKLTLNLRTQISELQKEVEKITEERDILHARIESRNIQGDYDPTKTRVLHFTMNPADQAQQSRAKQILSLQEEVARLRARVVLLEENESKLADLTLQVDKKLEEPTASSSEIKDMKAQLTSAELKNKRLVEAFKKTSHDFREVCYQLVGYRIDIPCNNQYRLMNMYADSPNDYLLFQQSTSGDIQMLGTEYSETGPLTEKIETYLQEAHSIPAFLSSITLEQFNKQTMMSSTMS